MERVLTTPSRIRRRLIALQHYYYYAAFNVPCVDHEDDELQAQIVKAACGGLFCHFTRSLAYCYWSMLND